MVLVTGHCVSEKVAAMLRELASEMAELVRQGEMSPEMAMVWYEAKAEQWKEGLS